MQQNRDNQLSKISVLSPPMTFIAKPEMYSDQNRADFKVMPQHTAQ